MRKPHARIKPTQYGSFFGRRRVIDAKTMITNVKSCNVKRTIN